MAQILLGILAKQSFRRDMELNCIYPQGRTMKKSPHPVRQSTGPLVPVVGIGASAGGLEAFTQLLSHLELHTGMAFVLIQHLDPSRESLLREILSRATRLPVVDIFDGMMLEPDHVYVMPPNTRLTLASSRFILEPRDKKDGHSPINDFFYSLAHEKKDRAIGIVLSGTASDGTNGLAALTIEGGITFAQTPESAKFQGMPAAAIAGGVDYVMTPQEIAAELATIAHSWSKTHSYAKKRREQADTPSQLVSLFRLLQTAKSRDFTYYKRPTIMRRIQRRMAAHKLKSMDEYIALLTTSPAEINSLYEDLLIKVSYFFRETESFTALKTQVFPHLLRTHDQHVPLRVWVPGCASGEEAYSLAMCFLECQKAAGLTTTIEIFATDVSETALAKARIGHYEQGITAQVSKNRLKRFFIADGHSGYKVTAQVRKCCVFAPQDVTNDPPFSKIDLISCRNVLIYFTAPLQSKILSIFHFALNPGGFLFLGNNESIASDSTLFEVLDRTHKIYRRLPQSTPIIIPSIKIEQFLAKRNAVEVPLPHPREEGTGADIRAAADRAILAAHVGAGVLINAGMEVLEFCGDVGPYLAHQPGKATVNLLKMCRPGLLVEVRHALSAAEKTGEVVRKDANVMMTTHSTAAVTIEVIPFTLADNARYFVVSFFPQLYPLAERGNNNSGNDAVVQQLTYELAEAKTYLNSLIEKEQTINEELKSTSEEMLSANEELQIANQEISSAREETQSANEELVTVNEELHHHIRETVRANNDLNNLFESIQLPLVMVSHNLTVRRISTSAEKVLNLTPKDIGTSLKELDATLYVKQLPHLVREVISTLNTRNQEVQDSHGRWFSLRIKPYRTQDNKIDGAVITLVDIDAMKRSFSLQQEGRVAKEFAEAANLAKTNFLTNMSHEIRSPLGVILGFAELLANPSRNPEEVRHYAGRIRNSIEHLTALVDEVLDIAKIEAGKLEVEVLRFPLLPELAETLSSLRSRAEGKGLHFSVEFRGEIPEMLTSNPQRLRQIIFNIVGNAIKFTEQGEIKVQIQCDISAVTPEAGMLTMVVSDTGCGLSEAQQQRLFLPFSQGDTSVTRKHGGTGLGLLLARRLAETLGGEVKLRESTPGAGSCFVLSVSTGSLQGVARLNKLSEADLAKSQSREAPWFVINQKLAGLHLLLVEDGADNQALMLQFLTSSGATVETAGNGVEALAAMEKGTFDLVLMDIQMPVMDGYQATKKLRDKGVITPIIALTAHAMTGERERCLAAGCGEYLSKPVSPTLLIEVVARMAKKTDMEVGVDEGRSLLVNHPVVGPIIGKFVGNLPERQNGLECALQREDYPAIGKLAHQIAGAAEGYGFPEIGTVAALLETQVRDNASPQHLAASIARFNHLCAAIQRAHPREEKKKGTPA